MLHVEFAPHGGGGPNDHVSVNTIDDAMAEIRKRFPTAVRRVGWDICGHEFDDRWYMASMRVWPDSQSMELDELGDRLVALVINESRDPPEPNARMFIGHHEIVDESDCSHGQDD